MQEVKHCCACPQDAASLGCSSATPDLVTPLALTAHAENDENTPEPFAGGDLKHLCASSGAACLQDLCLHARAMWICCRLQLSLCFSSC